ncbi:uncharacterized protein FOMMEDRAFT_156414 [Fomitiporia mediterranea MF3/22]|uniref:uncharacterized protein n=1 Tax=Fomitiporia mediterranea (strain MF3/22) TaxID=694068 RepID=UPI000440986B|nr:uncharacterized protein FOMMEDRAFT_156414 [Fomitiporia mediterranea MF3/22]EJD03048.1 hypothetical protein FOMMEDRAFT_156414 [Fomitiporia mediterranea MF3/22]
MSETNNGWRLPSTRRTAQKSAVVITKIIATCVEAPTRESVVAEVTNNPSRTPSSFTFSARGLSSDFAREAYATHENICAATDGPGGPSLEYGFASFFGRAWLIEVVRNDFSHTNSVLDYGQSGKPRRLDVAAARAEDVLVLLGRSEGIKIVRRKNLTTRVDVLRRSPKHKARRHRQEKGKVLRQNTAPGNLEAKGYPKG